MKVYIATFVGLLVIIGVCGLIGGLVGQAFDSMLAAKVVFSGLIFSAVVILAISV